MPKLPAVFFLYRSTQVSAKFPTLPTLLYWRTLLRNYRSSPGFNYSVLESTTEVYFSPLRGHIEARRGIALTYFGKVKYDFCPAVTRALNKIMLLHVYLMQIWRHTTIKRGKSTESHVNNRL